MLPFSLLQEERENVVNDIVPSSQTCQKEAATHSEAPNDDEENAEGTNNRNMLHSDCIEDEDEHQRNDMDVMSDNKYLAYDGRIMQLVADDTEHLLRICDTLSEARNNIMVEADLKIVLGYTTGHDAKAHRVWRGHRKRLLGTKCIEPFTAMVKHKLSEYCFC